MLGRGYYVTPDGDVKKATPASEKPTSQDNPLNLDGRLRNLAGGGSRSSTSPPSSPPSAESPEVRKSGHGGGPHSSSSTHTPTKTGLPSADVISGPRLPPETSVNGKTYYVIDKGRKIPTEQYEREKTVFSQLKQLSDAGLIKTPATFEEWISLPPEQKKRIIDEANRRIEEQSRRNWEYATKWLGTDISFEEWFSKPVEERNRLLEEAANKEREFFEEKRKSEFIRELEQELGPYEKWPDDVKSQIEKALESGKEFKVEILSGEAPSLIYPSHLPNVNAIEEPKEIRTVGDLMQYYRAHPKVFEEKWNASVPAKIIKWVDEEKNPFLQTAKTIIRDIVFTPAAGISMYELGTAIKTEGEFLVKNWDWSLDPLKVTASNALKGVEEFFELDEPPKAAGNIIYMFAPLAPSVIRTAGGGFIRVAKPAGTALIERGERLRGALFGTEERIKLLEVKRVRGAKESEGVIELTPEQHEHIEFLRNLPPEANRRGVQTALFADEPGGFILTERGWIPIASEDALMETRLHMIEKELPNKFSFNKGVQVTLPKEFEVIEVKKPGLFGYWDRLARKTERAEIIETGEVKIGDVRKTRTKKESAGHQPSLRDILGEYDEWGEPIWGEDIIEIKKPSKPFEWETKTEWENRNLIEKDITREKKTISTSKESESKSGKLELIEKGESETSLFGRKVRIVEEESYTVPEKLLNERNLKAGFRGPLIGFGADLKFGEIGIFEGKFSEIGIERTKSLVGSELKPDIGVKFDINENFKLDTGVHEDVLEISRIGERTVEEIVTGQRVSEMLRTETVTDTLTTTDTVPRRIKRTRRIRPQKPPADEEGKSRRGKKKKSKEKSEVRKFILMPKADLLSMTITEARLKGKKALHPAPTERNIRLYSREMKLRGTLMRFPTHQMQVWARSEKNRRVGSRSKRRRGGKRRR